MINWSGPPITKENEAILEAKYQYEKRRSEEIRLAKIIEKYGSIEAYRKHLNEQEEEKIIRQYGSREAYEKSRLEFEQNWTKF